MKRIPFFLIVAFIALNAIAAQPPAPKTDPMLRQLDYFVGKWQCSGTAFAMAGAPGHPVAATMMGRWVMGGHWLAVDYVGTKTKSDPQPMSVSAFLGYDPEIKKLMLGSIQNDGGYSVENSGGWSGDDLVFEGPNHMSGSTVKGRDEFHKVSNSELRYTFQLEMNGKWENAMQESCKRAK